MNPKQNKQGKNKGGRPKANIDETQFEKLCGLQCTKEEICGWFFITDKTLDVWVKETYNMSFSEVFKQKRQLGKVSLRRMQFRLAEKNATMAIFLGKNYLGQQDNQGVVIQEMPEIVIGVRDNERSTKDNQREDEI